MTLLEKVKEMGIQIVGEEGKQFCEGCPWTHGLETREESMAFCPGRHCWECYAR